MEDGVETDVGVRGRGVLMPLVVRLCVVIDAEGVDLGHLRTQRLHVRRRQVVVLLHTTHQLTQFMR